MPRSLKKTSEYRKPKRKDLRTRRSSDEKKLVADKHKLEYHLEKLKEKKDVDFYYRPLRELVKENYKLDKKANFQSTIVWDMCHFPDQPANERKALEDKLTEFANKAVNRGNSAYEELKSEYDAILKIPIEKAYNHHKKEIYKVLENTSSYPHLKEEIYKALHLDSAQIEALNKLDDQKLQDFIQELETTGLLEQLLVCNGNPNFLGAELKTKLDKAFNSCIANHNTVDYSKMGEHQGERSEAATKYEQQNKRTRQPNLTTTSRQSSVTP